MVVAVACFDHCVGLDSIIKSLVRCVTRIGSTTCVALSTRDQKWKYIFIPSRLLCCTAICCGAGVGTSLSIQGSSVWYARDADHRTRLATERLTFEVRHASLPPEVGSGSDSFTRQTQQIDPKHGIVIT